MRMEGAVPETKSNRKATIRTSVHMGIDSKRHCERHKVQPVQKQALRRSASEARLIRGISFLSFVRNRLERCVVISQMLEKLLSPFPRFRRLWRACKVPAKPRIM